MFMKVFHRAPLYGRSINKDDPLPGDLGWPALYTPAAVVKPNSITSNSIAMAYAATQTIEVPWWEHSSNIWSVTKLVPGICRSTAVGDIISYGRDFWVVADVGFVLIEKLPEAVA
ncbi:MAG TPA: hypothetical protein PKM21_15970 [Anaerolineales bacterium]|nr:hypothetical protein [Anaerolineales bacterium]